MRPVVELLCEEFQAPFPSPCGGSAAAVVAAIAASLVVMIGRNSPEWPEGEDAAASAAVHRERLLSLADEDVEVVAAVIAAGRGGQHDDGGSDLVAALLRSSEVPLEIAEHAAEIAVFARIAAREGNKRMRADVEAAASLASAAAEVAAAIVAGNLRAPQLPASDDRVQRLREAAGAASRRAAA